MYAHAVITNHWYIIDINTTCFFLLVYTMILPLMQTDPLVLTVWHRETKCE